MSSRTCLVLRCLYAISKHKFPNSTRLLYVKTTALPELFDSLESNLVKYCNQQTLLIRIQFKS